MPTVRSSGCWAYSRKPSRASDVSVAPREYTRPFQPGKLQELVPNRTRAGMRRARSAASRWTAASASAAGSRAVAARSGCACPKRSSCGDIRSRAADTPSLVVGLRLPGAIEDDAAVEDRDGHLRVEDPGRVRAEERGRQDDHVRKHAGLERAFPLLVKRRPG